MEKPIWTEKEEHDITTWKSIKIHIKVLIFLSNQECKLANENENIKNPKPEPIPLLSQR